MGVPTEHQHRVAKEIEATLALLLQDAVAVELTITATLLELGLSVVNFELTNDPVKAIQSENFE